MELSKYLCVVPEKVELTIKNIKAVNDMKISGTQDPIPIYVHGVKVNVWDSNQT